jgi:hypothetical protein
MILDLFGNQDHIDISDAISSVREFWQLYYSMADLKGTKFFTNQWKNRAFFGK